jgi:hypothetical protein
VTDPWQFWLDQLAGRNPPLPAEHAQPQWGFYLSRRRYSWPREGDEKKIGGARNKTFTYFWPTAIWADEGGWHCVITRAPLDGHDYKTSVLTDPLEIDESVFCACCRAAITHDDYLRRVADLETARDDGGFYQPRRDPATFTRASRMAAEDAKGVQS